MCGAVGAVPRLFLKGEEVYLIVLLASESSEKIQEVAAG